MLEFELGQYKNAPAVSPAQMVTSQQRFPQKSNHSNSSRQQKRWADRFEARKRARLESPQSVMDAQAGGSGLGTLGVGTSVSTAPPSGPSVLPMPQFSFTCLKCGQYGHRKNDCPYASTSAVNPHVTSQ